MKIFADLSQASMDKMEEFRKHVGAGGGGAFNHQQVYENFRKQLTGRGVDATEEDVQNYVNHLMQQKDIYKLGRS